MQHPRLNLGLIGFSAEQQTLIQAQLERAPAQMAGSDANKVDPNYPIWLITGYREANALLLNADHVSWADAQDLRFHSDAQHSDIVGLRPSELTMPFAICGTITPQMAAIVSDKVPNTVLHDERSMVHALQYFEALLRPLRTVYALAYQMAERSHELDNSHVFHVERDGKLEAIVDMPSQRVMVRDGLRPFDLDNAYWARRPPSANNCPVGFVELTTEELSWVLAMHGKNYVLPERYFKKKIYLRRLPHVRIGMFYPRHKPLLELLSQQGWSFADLAAALDGNDELLKRDLYALYLCRAVTTTARKLPPGVSYEASLQNSDAGQSTTPSLMEDFHLATIAADLR